ncbi:thioesterase II family protein [Streptomyces sp. NPDC059534]|uniref:thioesterase II family protein n=1 Tax=Streptomyces sp. NPDC059534 TaxID=3346859 RepID=UPI0036A84898
MNGEAVWDIRPDLPADAPSLLVLSHAGGSAHAYLDWEPLIPPHVRLLIGQYPGRGARYSEPLPVDVNDVADQLYQVLRDQPRLHVLGHSMGALVAFELALRLEREGRPPAGLVVSAARAAHLENPRPVHPERLDDEELAVELGVRGGTAPELLEDPDMRAMVLRVIRADFALDDAYRYTGPVPALSCPLTVLGGEDDPVVPVADLKAWHQLTTGSADMSMFPGGHFYFSDDLPTVLSAVGRVLPADRRNP